MEAARLRCGWTTCISPGKLMMSALTVVLALHMTTVFIPTQCTAASLDTASKRSDPQQDVAPSLLDPAGSPHVHQKRSLQRVLPSESARFSRMSADTDESTNEPYGDIHVSPDSSFGALAGDGNGRVQDYAWDDTGNPRTFAAPDANLDTPPVGHDRWRTVDMAIAKLAKSLSKTQKAQRNTQLSGAQIQALGYRTKRPSFGSWAGRKRSGGQAQQQSDYRDQLDETKTVIHDFFNKDGEQDLNVIGDESKRGKFSAWRGRKRSGAAKKRLRFHSWNGKRSLPNPDGGTLNELADVRYKRRPFKQWGGKRTVPTLSFVHKRPSFSAWAGKRSVAAMPFLNFEGVLAAIEETSKNEYGLDEDEKPNINDNYSIGEQQFKSLASLVSFIKYLREQLGLPQENILDVIVNYDSSSAPGTLSSGELPLNNGESASDDNDTKNGGNNDKIEKGEENEEDFAKRAQEKRRSFNSWAGKKRDSQLAFAGMYDKREPFAETYLGDVGLKEALTFRKHREELLTALRALYRRLLSRREQNKVARVLSIPQEGDRYEDGEKDLKEEVENDGLIQVKPDGNWRPHRKRPAFHSWAGKRTSQPYPLRYKRSSRALDNSIQKSQTSNLSELNHNKHAAKNKVSRFSIKNKLAHKGSSVSKNKDSPWTQYSSATVELISPPRKADPITSSSSTKRPRSLRSKRSAEGNTSPVSEPDAGISRDKDNTKANAFATDKRRAFHSWSGKKRGGGSQTERDIRLSHLDGTTTREVAKNARDGDAGSTDKRLHQKVKGISSNGLTNPPKEHVKTEMNVDKKRHKNVHSLDEEKNSLKPKEFEEGPHLAASDIFKNVGKSGFEYNTDSANKKRARFYSWGGKRDSIPYLQQRRQRQPHQDPREYFPAQVFSRQPYLNSLYPSRDTGETPVTYMPVSPSSGGLGSIIWPDLYLELSPQGVSKRPAFHAWSGKKKRDGKVADHSLTDKPRSFDLWSGQNLRVGADYGLRTDKRPAFHAWRGKKKRGQGNTRSYPSPGYRKRPAFHAWSGKRGTRVGLAASNVSPINAGSSSYVTNNMAAAASKRYLFSKFDPSLQYTTHPYERYDSFADLPSRQDISRARNELFRLFLRNLPAYIGFSANINKRPAFHAWSGKKRTFGDSFTALSSLPGKDNRRPSETSTIDKSQINSVHPAPNQIPYLLKRPAFNSWAGKRAHSLDNAHSNGKVTSSTMKSIHISSSHYPLMPTAAKLSPDLDLDAEVIEHVHPAAPAPHPLPPSSVPTSDQSAPVQPGTAGDSGHTSLGQHLDTDKRSASPRSHPVEQFRLESQVNSHRQARVRK